jgi:uncharacterized iron-regulated membrane protein
MLNERTDLLMAKKSGWCAFSLVGIPFSLAGWSTWMQADWDNLSG